MKKESSGKLAPAFPYKSFSAAHDDKEPELNEALFAKYYADLAEKFLPRELELDLRYNLDDADVEELELLNGRSSHSISCLHSLDYELAKHPELGIHAEPLRCFPDHPFSVFENERICNFLALAPLRAIRRLILNVKSLQEYVPFFTESPGSKQPEHPLVEVREADTFGQSLLDDLEIVKLTFWLMANGGLRSCEGVEDDTDCLLNDIEVAFELYIRFYETIGNDEIWDITFRLRKIWFDLCCALDAIAYARTDEFTKFNASLDSLRTTFLELPPVLYKLECRRYQELSKKTGTSIYRPSSKKKT